MLTKILDLPLERVAMRLEDTHISPLFIKIMNRRLRDNLRVIVDRLRDQLHTIEDDISRIPQHVNLDTARSIVGGRGGVQTANIAKLIEEHQEYVLTRISLSAF